MRLLTSSIFLVSCAFASESLSPPSTSRNMLDSALLTLSTSSPQPQVPNLELRYLELDRRQIQPAAVGAPAQVAAGAAQQPNAGAAAPAAANPVAPVAPVVQTTAPLAPTALTATPPVVATPAAAPAGGGGGGAIGGIPIIQGPAIPVTSAPPPRSGSIGLGTLTGQIGVVKTDEAKSEAGLAAGKRFGFIASWPSAFKVGASLLLGTAVGVGILL